jgi:hypothetical protein
MVQFPASFKVLRFNLVQRQIPMFMNLFLEGKICQVIQSLYERQLRFAKVSILVRISVERDKP